MVRVALHLDMEACVPSNNKLPLLLRWVGWLITGLYNFPRLIVDGGESVETEALWSSDYWVILIKSDALKLSRSSGREYFADSQRRDCLLNSPRDRHKIWPFAMLESECFMILFGIPKREDETNKFVIPLLSVSCFGSAAKLPTQAAAIQWILN